MSVDKYDDETADTVSQATPQKPPKPDPWCLACGCQHAHGLHCAGCNGDHSAGYCMTDQLAAQLARVGHLRPLVDRAADRLYDQVLRVVRSQGGK